MTTDIHIDTNTATATVSGRLDTASASLFEQQMKPLIDNADKVITLDCTNLEFISSSGLRLLLTLRKATMAQGGRVVIRNASENIQQVFSITGFTSLFDFE